MSVVPTLPGSSEAPTTATRRGSKTARRPSIRRPSRSDPLRRPLDALRFAAARAASSTGSQTGANGGA